MSFTAEVKDELSRIEGRMREDRRAELAALARIDGTLGIAGGGYRLSIDTETASVARRMLILMHELYPVKTDLATRRSVLHKSFNFLITVPMQPALPDALRDLGIISADGGLWAGISPHLVKTAPQAAAYLRGAFLASGFIADPKGDLHFELTVEGEDLAQDIVALMCRHGINARYVVRRSSHIIYLKGAEQIISFLAFTGAHRGAIQMEDARVMKSVRNDVNRIVNAELANQNKASRAAYSQIQSIRRLVETQGMDSIPQALREVAKLRLANPEMSLRELGQLADPPLSKSAVAHRIRRIGELARGI